MSTNTFATFKAESFAPFLPECKQVNDGVYGAELAWWLCKKLADNEVYTSYPEFEDHTWILNFEHNEHEFEIHCHNQFQKKHHWELKIRTFKLGLFSNKRTSGEALTHLCSLLEKPLKETNEVSELVIYSLC